MDEENKERPTSSPPLPQNKNPPNLLYIDTCRYNCPQSRSDKDPKLFSNQLHILTTCQ